MPPIRTDELSPEMALITRYRRREGTTEPELGFKPLARKISRASGHRFGEQRWRRRESGEVGNLSDTDLAWMAWSVDVPPDELAATGRADAADLLRQIITEQEIKSAQPAPAGPSEDDLTTDGLTDFVQQALAEIDALPGRDEESLEAKKRMKKFILQQTRTAAEQARAAVDMLHPR